jgi:hypothetical protein
VLDLVTQVPDVVFVNCIFSLGNPRGSGFRNEGHMGWSGEMGRSVYEQPGSEVDRILSQQGGFQVSKGKRKGSKRDEERENRKQGDCSQIVLLVLYWYIVNACNV